MRMPTAAAALAFVALGCTSASDEPPATPVPEAPPPPCGTLAPEACFEQARGSLDDLDADRVVLAERFAWLCTAGDLASACVELGRMHRMGRGVERSEEAAARWYGEGCARRQGAGCHNAGLVARRAGDIAAARGLFTQACDLDYAHGCLLLGMVHRDGEAGGADPQAALAAFDRGCAGGLVEACGAQGRLLLDAAAGPDDVSTAAALLRLACNAGDLEACHESAELLDAGLGVRQDRAAARQLWLAACDGGVTRACAALE